jgi:two-component system, NarL family, response regulator NreC
MRTLLVDDQRMFREGLRALLRERKDVEIVGETPSARQAYELVRRLGPQLVITELILPRVDGVTAAREIRRLRPECKILVLTACKEMVRLQSAWLSGIDACVTKDDSVETLVSAIASLGVGRRFVSPVLRRTGSALRNIDERYARGTDPLASLSRREREVFDLIVRGASTKAVAQELCISPKTVETHRTHINEKLALHSTADLVRYAFRNDLHPLGDVKRGSKGRRTGGRTDGHARPSP